MNYDFDQTVERRGSDSAKWSLFERDVLPLWVADMDFVSPQPILDALHRRVDHGVFGYAFDLSPLRAAICARMQRLHKWEIDPEAVVFLPGLVSGLNVVCRAVGEPGDGVLVNTPVYPPFLTAPGNQKRQLHVAEQRLQLQNGRLHYTVDFEALEEAIAPNTRLFILCNPHNPTGRAYTPAELRQMAEICDRHDLIICSDEIHCDLLLDGTRHTPIAALDPEIAARTITLLAPSKTYNIPALGCSVALIPDPELRRQMGAASGGIVPHVNVLGMHAALAAYTECDDWLGELLAYLTANRDYVVETVGRCLPDVSTTVPEATYLAWLDCRATVGGGNPHEFFLQEAKVALNDGHSFGQGGDGFVRLNFGCPRATLTEALERMQAALERVTG